MRCSNRTDVDVDENFRDRESVLDQGFARPPDLGTVGSFCKVIGVGQKDKVVRGPHAERGFEQVVKERVPGSALESLLVRGGLLRAEKRRGIVDLWMCGELAQRVGGPDSGVWKIYPRRGSGATKHT